MTSRSIVETFVAAAMIFGVAYAWRQARKGDRSPRRAAAFRAAVLTGIFAPAIMPGAHGILPLPSGLVAFFVIMSTISGDPTPWLDGQGLMLMFAIPTVVFFTLWGFFARRARA